MSGWSGGVGDPHDSVATVHERSSICPSCKLDVVVVQPRSPEYDASNFHRKNITEDDVIISADSQRYPTLESHRKRRPVNPRHVVGTRVRMGR